MGRELFNHLPQDCRTKGAKRKTSFQRCLLEWPYYSLEEFLDGMLWYGILLLTTSNKHNTTIFVLFFILMRLFAQAKPKKDINTRKLAGISLQC